jgi:hypothetical protein
MKSWKSEIYTHFKYDIDGRWIDSGLRYGSEAEALRSARKLLQRIITADERMYRQADFDTHCRAVPSDEAANAVSPAEAA